MAAQLDTAVYEKNLTLFSSAVFSGRNRLFGDQHEHACQHFFRQHSACGVDEIAILADFAILVMFDFLVEHRQLDV